MKATTELVTPKMAQDWLGKNTGNRPVSEMNVQHLLAIMQRKQWTITTDAIGFDINGVLNNGQHRLIALVRYGKELPFLVCRQMPLLSFNAIDTGKMRNAGDVLGANGISSSRSKSSIVSFLIQSKDGIRSANGSSKANKISNQDVLNFYNKNKNNVEEAYMASITYTKKFKAIEARYIGALYYIFSSIDKSYAEKFFEAYNSGLGLSAGNPIFALREKLIMDMQSTKKYSPADKMAWTVLCWNAFHAGRTLKVIRHSEITGIPKPI